jgi:hypothetical protein
MIDFAFIDADGYPTAGGRLRELPDGAVPLPERFTKADLSRLRYRDGVWEERPVVSEPEPAPSAEEIAAWQAAMLDRARAASVTRINAETDTFRRQFYTSIAGQDALYLEKRAEALAYIREADQAGEPATLDDYPLLANEVGITAPTPWQLAQIWLHLSEAFKTIGAATERPRQIAMNAIAAAPDEDALRAIETAFAQTLADLATKGS